LAPIAVVTAVTLLIAGVVRYRAAAEPSIVILAALGALTVWNRVVGSGRQSSLTSTSSAGASQ
jgi:hypothetical protein